MIEILIICTIFGVFIMASFIIGLYYGSKIKNNEKIDMPKIEPIKAIKEKIIEIKDSKQEKLEQEILDINMANIDNYDGSSIGQKDFPRRIS